MNHLAQLPFLPISVPHLMESAFFLSKKPEVVRAGIFMLEAAWRADPAGSIPAAFSVLSVITRIPEHELSEHYDVLTQGWTLQADGRLHNAYMETVAESVSERFGPELATIADSAVVACQGGAAPFELLPPVEVAKKKRGAVALPKNFKMDSDSLGHVLSEGYVLDEHQAWLLQQFRDYALEKNTRTVNWQAALRNSASNTYVKERFKLKFGHFPGQTLQPLSQAVPLSAHDRLRARLGGAGARMPTFAQQTIQSNSDKMAMALERRYSGESAVCGVGL